MTETPKWQIDLRNTIVVITCLWLMLLADKAGALDCDLTSSVANTPEKRIALVVGNSDYNRLPTTPNARNDALDMARMLADTGFDVVCGINLTRKEFLDKIGEYRQRIDSAGSDAVSLFYYAGHGVQLNGNNYLIPVGANVSDKAVFDDETVSLNTLMHVLVNAGNHRGSRFIILDACRDNPLGKGWGKPRAQYSIKGLQWVFGTGYGKVAYDGGGRNGLFTKHLLRSMQTPGATFDQVIKMVVAAVDHESDGGQIPETGGSAIRDFMFVPGNRISVNTTYEDTPLWLKLLYWTGLGLALLTAGLYYRYRQQTAWVKGIDLTARLNIDKKVADEIQRKTRLATDEIVGYVKNLREGKLVGLMTSKFDMVLGRNNNVNIVIDSDTVSGEHAQIGWDAQNQSFWIEDLGSTNGTWWGKGKRLQANRRYPLESGRVFYLADQNTPMVVIAHSDAE